MTQAISLTVLLLATFMCWGVGITIQLLARTKPRTGPMSIGIGLAAIIFVGGFLNLAHIAYAPALWATAGIALVVSVIEARRVKLELDRTVAARTELIAAAIVIAAATLFAVVTQLPPRAFNFHDDLQKYFAHPVRMLETGTLAGSTLSALGSETLGAQALLHGFVLSIAPIGYINGVDAIFGMFALMLVLASAGWRRSGWFPGSLLGPLMVAAINPQYVNVSGLYNGALLMATAMLLVIGDAESGNPPPLVMGLVYAALIAIKPTFALFVVLHLLIGTPAIYKTLGPALDKVKWHVATSVWTVVGLLPWVALYLPNYLAHGALPRASVPPGNDGMLHLFSTQHLFYGATFAHYTALALVATLIAIAAQIAAHRVSDPVKQRQLLGIFAGAAAGVLSYLIIVAAMGPMLNGYETNLRYSIPFLLGTCVTAIVMAPALAAALPSWLSVCVSIAAGLLITGTFVPSLMARDGQAVRFGSILAFRPLATSPEYLAYNQDSLSDAARQYVRAFQGNVPPGESLVAWTSRPYLLDYKRNTIIDADTMGISSSWARIPARVHYVLWQYNGFAVRTEGDYIETMQGPGAHERNIAAQALAFGDYLSQLSKSAKVIASDGQTVLFELPTQSHN